MGTWSGILSAVGTWIAPGVGTAIGGAIGGAIDGQQAKNSAESAASGSEEFQVAMMEKAQAYNTRMSNTSYQRGMEDLRKAGLNPALVINRGGASTPTSPMATGVNRIETVNTALQAMNLAQQGRESDARIQNIQQDTLLKAEQTNKEAFSAANIEAQTDKIREEIPKLREEVQHVKAMTGSELWRQTIMNVQEELYKTEAALKRGQMDLVEAETQYARIKTVLSKLAEPEARNAANAQDSWWMRNVSPYLPDLLKSTGAAGGLRGLAR